MKKIIVFVLSLVFVFSNGFMLFEGTFALADVTSTVPVPGNTSLEWDLQLNMGSQLSLVCESTSTMSFGGPYGIGGTMGNVDRDRYCNVITNDANGWTLAIRATGTPVLENGPTHNIPDYPTSTPSAWTVTSTDAYFGFSASSSKATSSFSNTFTDKYRGFNTTSDIPVASDASSTDSGGVRTDFRFRLNIGADAIVYPVNYGGHVVVTAYGL